MQWLSICLTMQVLTIFSHDFDIYKSYGQCITFLGLLSQSFYRHSMYFSNIFVQNTKTCDLILIFEFLEVMVLLL